MGDFFNVRFSWVVDDDAVSSLVGVGGESDGVGYANMEMSILMTC
jgi:hypothetical protein